MTITTGYKLTLLPLRVVESGSQPQTVMSAAERGRALFVAKGCVTCHQNNLKTSNQEMNVGPALLPQKYQPDYLARMLADPASLIPPRPESPVRMPNLHLEQQEIASLVAFINTGVVTASR
jgi:cytochrome c551/c552